MEIPDYLVRSISRHLQILVEANIRNFSNPRAMSAAQQGKGEVRRLQAMLKKYEDK